MPLHLCGPADPGQAWPGLGRPVLGLGSAGVRVDAGGPGGTSSSSMAGAWPAVIPHRDEAVFPLPQVGLSFFSW